MCFFASSLCRGESAKVRLPPSSQFSAPPSDAPRGERTTAHMKVCPSCGSSKIRNGYLRPPLLLRLLLIREFLCEGCNLEFRAFALRPAKSRGVRMRRKANRFNQAPAVDLSLLNQASPNVKPATAPTFNFDPAMITPPARIEPAEMMPGLPVREHHSAAATHSQAKKHLSSRPDRPCPHCGSHDTRRRHRQTWERVILYFTEIRAFRCQSCGASFYARREQGQPR